MKPYILFISFLFCIITGVYGQSGGGHEKVVFRFTPGSDGFFLRGNEAELQRLYQFVDTHYTVIINGQVPVYVTSYSNALPTQRENLNLALHMANRVKSELIIHKRLREEHFRTVNRAQAYDTYPSAVVVEITVPAKPVEVVQTRESEPEKTVKEVVKPPVEPVVEVLTEPAPVPVWDNPYTLAVRTNLLYDAFLLPTLGLEWRVNRNIGIKLDGSLSWWGGNSGTIQRIWVINPEVRHYLGEARNLYLGLGGTVGHYNLYKGVGLWRIFTADTGYQGELYSGGLTGGYQLKLSGNWSLDFNLGLGYTHLTYDTFTVSNQTRVYKEREKTKNIWGVTQAGVSLVWKFMK